MTGDRNVDVIIVGGSYSGLAAGMALGRALKKVLIIDEEKPCNRQTPHSHNFITHDGKNPIEIATLAKEQVQQYADVKFFSVVATTGQAIKNGYEIQVTSGEKFEAKKLIFATGIKDTLPDIEGLAACWGISVLQCPYCHGYEVRYEKTGILGNGDEAFDFARLISNWTQDLTIFTNGTSTLTAEQYDKLQHHKIHIVEKQIDRLEHNNGDLHFIHFKDGSQSPLKALYAPSPFEQHCKIPEHLGCDLDEDGYIRIDVALETSIKGVYAIGDIAAKMRTVANAVAMGTTAGMIISKKMILEEF